MPNKTLLSSLILLATLGAESADAAVTFVEGNHDHNDYSCPDGNVYKLLDVHAAYATDTENPVGTGDVAYVRAVAWNLSPCMPDEARFYFILPEGASLAISSQVPVLCMIGKSDNTWSYLPHDPANGMECLQAPIVDKASDGSQALYFGRSPLPNVTSRGGWYFEIRVPVVYQKRLDGSTTAQQLRVVSTTTTSQRNLVASVGMNVAFKPKFEDHKVLENTTGVSAKVGFDLTHYFEYGVVDVVYGTDPNNLSQGSQMVATSTTQLNHLDSTATLSGLNTVTTYYWRVRIHTNQGMWQGPLQSFTTPAASLQQPRCFRGYCW